MQLPLTMAKSLGTGGLHNAVNEVSAEWNSNSVQQAAEDTMFYGGSA